jgi:hypothetical protein
MKRTTALTAIQINVPNPAQAAPFPIVMTSIVVLTDAAGQQVGHPMQQQLPVIADDLSPEVVAALNGQLAYLGFALAPVAAAQATE